MLHTAEEGPKQTESKNISEEEELTDAETPPRSVGLKSGNISHHSIVLMCQTGFSGILGNKFIFIVLTVGLWCEIRFKWLMWKLTALKPDAQGAGSEDAAG